MATALLSTQTRLGFTFLATVALIGGAACTQEAAPAAPSDTTVSVRSALDTTVVVTVVDGAGVPQDMDVAAWLNNGTIFDYAATNASGQATFVLPANSYRFAVQEGGIEFFSGAVGHCMTPGCTSTTITITRVDVLVTDTSGAPRAGQTVAWETPGGEVDGYTDTGADGHARIPTPAGSYRFLLNVNGLDYTSGPAGHCVVPGCASASITVPGPVTVTVTDTGGAPLAGKPVVWMNAAGDTGGSTNTNASGVATLTPPLEPVRFRVAVDGTQFFSGPSVHCNQPGCTSATISVSQPTVVTVVDGAGAPISGRAVTALLGNATTGTNKSTGTNGQVTFRLPFGNWRFRATCTANSEQFFSGNASHCFIPGGCLTANIRMPCGQCAGTGTNGNLCNDANPCTTGEACQNQRCTGGTLFGCSASDQCHDVGACNAETGTAICSNPPKANGASCNDSNACTQSDTCQTGACVGANPIVCNAQDQCHVAGTCSPATGTCSASPRAADGTGCSDGNRCSTGDSCRAGTCLPGTTNGCAGTAQPNYVSVIDLGSVQGWSYATGINNSGVVVGADVPPDAGIYQLGFTGSKGFRWSESEGVVYLPWSGPVSYAVDINDAGVMSVTAGSLPSEMRPCRYDPAVDPQPVCHPFAGNAAGINAAGTLTGSSYYPDSFVRLFRLGTGPIEILPSASGPDPRAKGVAIANDGTVVGNQMVDGGWQGIRYSAARGAEHLVGLLPAGSGWTTAVPSSIKAGEILGWGYRAVGYGRAFRMKTAANGDVTEIVELPMPSTFASNAQNIMSASKSNASGEIVGSVYDVHPFWPEAAFVHTDTVGSIDLNTLIDPQSGWTLKGGFAINDNHEVVGYGVHGGVYRAYKLKLPDLGPCPLENSCRTGVRDALSGACSYTEKPNGAACDDANACTMGDVCTGGVCAGSTTVACVAPDACRTAGTCNVAAPSPSPPSTQDLIGWWRMEGNGDDASGGGHPLANEGAVAAPGRIGKGMKFDGSTCMTAPIWQEARMQGASGVTVMAWMSPSEGIVCPITPQGMTVAGRGWDYSVGAKCDFATPHVAAVPGLRLAGVQNWGYGSGWGGVYPNQWVHTAFTWEGGTWRFYFNGQLVQAGPAQGALGDIDPTFAVGCMVSWLFTQNQRIQHFKGTIDEVMLYRRALTPAEIGSYFTAADPCVHLPVTDGTACSDSNACTQTDTCQTGSCVGGNPKTCASSDQCHAAGACDPSNGVCSDPVKANGATCNDGQTCTQSETCLAGSCQDTNDYPTVLNLPVQDLGSFGPQSFPNDINASGVAVGWASPPDFSNHAWRSEGPGTITDLAALLGLGSPSSAQAINDNNMIVGFHTTAGRSRTFRYGQPGGFEEVPDISDGSPVLNAGDTIVLHAGTNLHGAFPTEINNAGEFVGFYTLGGKFRGYRYDDATGMEDVGGLAADGTTFMYGISESGAAVGSSSLGADPASETRAVLYENNIVGLRDLNVLVDSSNPQNDWTLLTARSISGDFVVGTGRRTGDGGYRAYRLNTVSGVVDDLSGGWLFSEAKKVNATGDTVGVGVRTAEDAAIAFLTGFVYTNQLGFKRLNDVIAHDQSWGLQDASSINAAGQIVGWGYHAASWGPTPFRTRLPAGESASCQARNICGGDTDQVCLFSDGVVQKADGTFVAVFGYDSSSTSSITPTQNEVRVNGNLVTSPQPAPPAQLSPGTRPGAYLPRFTAGQTVSWTVNGEIVTASATSPRLPLVRLATGGYGVIIGGTPVLIQPDVTPYATIPDDPTLPIPGPLVIARFNGTMKGALGVGPTGAATYTVPIAIPPGISGTAPNLSLVYNSQGGNGIAGQGWELAGLSMIHRCSKTDVQDGLSQPVRMLPRWGDGNGSEGVCLDGNRLFHRGNNVYELEAQDFSRITATSGLSDTPQQFTIVTKTGETRHYGHRADSRVLFAACQEPNPTVACGVGVGAWMLDRVMDVWGNYYEIHYNEDVPVESPSDFYERGVIVTQINYTGHVGGPSADPQPTFASVKFEYQQRPDKRLLRFANSTLPRNRRLWKIKTAVGSTTVGTYELTYKHDYDSAQPYGPDNDPMLPSRLASIGYCANGTCLESLEFGWDGGDYRWEQVPHAADVGQENSYEPPVAVNVLPNSGNPQFPGTQFVDLDGDGRLDLVQSIAAASPNDPPSVTHAWRNNGHGWSSMSAWALPKGLVSSDRKVNGYLADLNGDGRADLITQHGYEPPDVFYNRLTTAGGNWEPDGGGLRASWSNWVDGPGHVVALDFRTVDVVADMDGDGRADLVHFGNQDQEQLQVKLNKGIWQGAPKYAIPSSSQTGPPSDYTLADINRDGLPDLVPKEGTMALINLGDLIAANGTVWALQSAGANSKPDAKPRRVGDVDGDGLFDSFWITAAPFSLSTGLAFSTGLNYTVVGANPYVTVANNAIRSAIDGDFNIPDVNADGLVDLVAFQPLIGNALYINRGNTWLETSQGNRVPRVPDADYLDLDGDGVTDLVQSSTASGSWQRGAWLNKFRPPVIDNFPNGIAQKTQVKYDVITTAAAQAPGGTYSDYNPRKSGTTYLAGPLRVVASIAADDGLAAGTRATTTYRYESLRGSPFGRGPQGFMKVKVTDPARITTETEYAQHYPYTGLVKSVTRYASISTSDSNPGSQDRVLVAFAKTETSYCDAITETAGNLLCSSGLTPLETKKSRFVYPFNVVETRWLLTDSSFDFSGNNDTITTTSDFRYDARGNPLRITVKAQSSAGDVYTKETVNTYGTSGSTEEAMGKVTLAVVKSKKGGTGEITRTTKFDYAPVNSFEPAPDPVRSTLGLVKTTVEPGGGPSIEMQTVYAYDRFGNITTTTGCASDFDSCIPGGVNPSPPDDPQHPPFRTTNVSFDPTDFTPPATTSTTINSLSYGPGRFPVKTTNALGHAEYTAFDPLKGVLLQSTGPNGIHTRYTYDDLGYRTSEVQRFGSSAALQTTFDQYYPRNAPAATARIVTITTPPDGGLSIAYTDVLGRTVYTAKRILNALFTQTYSLYDGAGRLARTTAPFTVGQMYFTTSIYDDLGRVREVEQEMAPIDGSSSPTTSTVRTKYTGLTTETEQSVGGRLRVRRETKNALGKVASVTAVASEDDPTQPTSTTIGYGYDAEGNLTAAGDPSLQNQLPTVETHYDARGRKDFTVDPDMGTWRYAYDGFGELIKETDAKLNETLMTYDALGRLIRKDTAAGAAQWVYDRESGGIGKLAAMMSAPDIRLKGPCAVPHATFTNGYRTGRSFKYTPLGELEEVSECADGETFVTSYNYDLLGRQSLIRYPEVRGSRLAVEYHYTHLGFLHYLTNASDGSLYWAATEMNPLGQVTKESLGNGVETVSQRNAVTGWLMGSSSVAHADGDALIQNWSNRYDQVGSLRYRERSDSFSGGNSVESFDYDSFNRLITANLTIPSRSYARGEDYRYDSLGNITSKAGIGYTYTGCAPGPRPAGPHAVCTAGTSAPFAYDENGNMVSGASRSVRYNDANRPVRIESNSSAVDFVYDADGNRVIQEVGPLGGPTTSSARTLYVGLGATGKSIYERTTRAGSTEHVQFIYAGVTHGGSAFALRVIQDEGATPTATATKYLHFDHLGSITAMSDEIGHVVSSDWGPDATLMGYDAWGLRRGPLGEPASPGSLNLQAGHREFTGHETIPDVGLVNMNGRVYDPALGRFLSPDPNVQFPLNLQSYNRYSYVLNNPLSYGDPTGYFLGITWNGVAHWSFQMAMGVIVTSACASTGGAACVAAIIGVAFLNGSAMMAQGASFEQAVASGAVTSAAYALGAWAGGLPAHLMISMDTGIGFVEGIATAKIMGADDGEALKVGLVSAGISGGAAAVSVGVRALAEAEYEYRKKHNIQTEHFVGLCDECEALDTGKPVEIGDLHENGWIGENLDFLDPYGQSHDGAMRFGLDSWMKKGPATQIPLIGRALPAVNKVLTIATNFGAYEAVYFGSIWMAEYGGFAFVVQSYADQQ